MTEKFLKGRRALVTGSSGGLGNCMACALAAAGADVMLTDLYQPAEVEAARRDLARRYDVQVVYRQTNLGVRREVEQLLDAAVGGFGGVDILVNNAVVRHFMPIEEFSASAWDQSLAINLSAPFHAIRAALPGMRRKDYGRIINMTSVFATRATVNRVDYITTKAGIEGLTKATALEVAGSGISCHALCPGSVLTPPNSARVDELREAEKLTRAQAEARFLEGKQPSGKFVSPDSIRDVLLLLCGPAGPDMNGAILPIEAGWLAKS